MTDREYPRWVEREQRIKELETALAKAEKYSRLSEAAKDRISMLEATVHDLEEQVSKLESERNQLQRENQRLRKYVQDMYDTLGIVVDVHGLGEK